MLPRLSKRRFFGAHINTDKKLFRIAPRRSKQGVFWLLTHTEKSCQDWLLRSCRILHDFFQSFYLLRLALRRVYFEAMPRLNSMNDNTQILFAQQTCLHYFKSKSLCAYSIHFYAVMFHLLANTLN